jgi:hypothetical protein
MSYVTLFFKLRVSEAFSNSAICQSASLPEDLPRLCKCVGSEFVSLEGQDGFRDGAVSASYVLFQSNHKVMAQTALYSARL